MADELTPEQIAAQEAAQELANQEAAKEEAKKQRNEIMRGLSEEYGFNLFDADGIKQYKEYLDSQKTEHEKVQEELNALKTEKETWTQEKSKFAAQIKASELGISKENLEDALKLAGGDPEKLADVVKKYPVFKSKEGIQIGIQGQETPPPTGNTEAEEYMAQNPMYRNYLKK